MERLLLFAYTRKAYTGRAELDAPLAVSNMQGIFTPRKVREPVLLASYSRNTRDLPDPSIHSWLIPAGCDSDLDSA